MLISTSYVREEADTDVAWVSISSCKSEGMPRKLDTNSVIRADNEVATWSSPTTPTAIERGSAITAEGNSFQTNRC
jgi:hypothetical protein